MALRWFIGVVATQIVGQSSRSQCSEEAQGKKVTMDEVKRPAVKIVGERGGFHMPVNYPRYKKEEYERMEEWKVDMLLMEYGLGYEGSVEEKRAFAMGTFLWPDQL